MMRDVVVIGGGLTGLAAAYELEQHKIEYTLIEVKRQAGGSIGTIRQDGFTLDSGAFALADTLDRDWLQSLGLADALFPLNRDAVAFKGGTGMLVNALQRKLTMPRLMRMAVSSIGELEDGRCAICLENGVMLDARALIIAVPARYAERLFYGYITPLTEMLLDYRYDTIQRVSLGFHTTDLPQAIDNVPDMAYVFIHRTEHPSRVPPGHTLLQFGLRIAPERLTSPQQAVDLLREAYNLPEPVTQLVTYWPEADPISVYDDNHIHWVDSLRQQLPEKMALVGSDYCLHAPYQKGIARLDERIAQGQQAARQMIRQLK